MRSVLEYAECAGIKKHLCEYGPRPFDVRTSACSSSPPINPQRVQAARSLARQRDYFLLFLDRGEASIHAASESWSWLEGKKP